MSASPTKPKFFIGSSSEAEPLVDALVAECRRRPDFALEPLPWRIPFDDAQRRNKKFLDVILEQAVDCAMAVFFWTPDDIRKGRPEGRSRNISRKEHFVPRDNVVLEAGIFLGALGRRRVLTAINKSDVEEEAPETSDFAASNLKIPSDFTDDLQVREQYYTGKRKVNLPGIRKLADRLEKDWREQRFVLERGASRVYTSREDCYLAGIELVKKSQHKLASVLSYESEVIEGDEDVWSKENTLENKLYKSIRAKMAEVGMPVYRWFNKDVASIERQMKDLLEYAKAMQLHHSVHIKDTKCKFIEILIADDEVLIVLPQKPMKSGDEPNEVATGVHIHNPVATKYFFDWFLNHLPDGHNLLQP